MTTFVYKSNINGFPENISPANFWSSRLSFLAEKELCFASGNQIYQFSFDTPKKESQLNDKLIYSNEIKLSPLNIIKTNLEEIQTLETDIKSKRINAIDSFGNISIFNDKYENVFNYKNDYVKLGSNGWCGVKIHPNDPNEFCSASFFDKTITLFNNDKFDRKINCIGNPTSINYITNNNLNLICTTEDSHICLWDIKQKNPLIKRLYVSQERLLSTCFSGNMLATAGESRSAYIIDSSTWTLSDVWSNCSKYEITSIEFAKDNDSLLYVSGLNSEILCGSWRNKKGMPKRRLKERNKSFKADSNWLGIQQSLISGFLAGITESGNLYVLENPQHLEQGNQEEEESPQKNNKKNKSKNN